jgi:hypothetical protein
MELAIKVIAAAYSSCWKVGKVFLKKKKLFITAKDCSRRWIQDGCFWSRSSRFVVEIGRS